MEKSFAYQIYAGLCEKKVRKEKNMDGILWLGITMIQFVANTIQWLLTQSWYVVNPAINCIGSATFVSVLC